MVRPPVVLVSGSEHVSDVSVPEQVLSELEKTWCTRSVLPAPLLVIVMICEVAVATKENQISSSAVPAHVACGDAVAPCVVTPVNAVVQVVPLLTDKVTAPQILSLGGVVVNETAGLQLL